MAKRSKASYKAAAKKAAATRKRNASKKKGGTKKGQVRKTARRAYKPVSRPKGGCTSRWSRYRWPKGKVINGKKVGGTFKTNKGKRPTGRRESALCPDTRTVR